MSRKLYLLEEKECPKCNGDGKGKVVSAPSLQGSPQSVYRNCSECEGSGYILEPVPLSEVLGSSDDTEQPDVVEKFT